MGIPTPGADRVELSASKVGNTVWLKEKWQGESIEAQPNTDDASRHGRNR
jgi:hypothetical protein